MSRINYAAKDNAESTLLSNITASDLTIPLVASGGLLFPTPLSGAASSTGDSQTLNDTGDLGSLAVGNFIRNVTDGSWAIVISIASAPNTVTTTRLRNGTLNVWTSGDVWRSKEFTITLEKRDVDGDVTNREIALVTANSGDNLTVPTGGRGYAGSTAQSFSAGDYVTLQMTTVFIEDMQAVMAAIAEWCDYNQTLISSLFSDEPYWLGTVTGTDTLTGSGVPDITAYVTGRRYVFKAANDNTGAVTINIDSVGAKTIKKTDGATDLAAGDIQGGQVVELIYDGTYMQIVSPLGQASVGSDITVSAKTADYSVGAGDSGKMFTTEGASAPVKFTLPSAVAGYNQRYMVVDTLIAIEAASGDNIKNDDGRTYELVHCLRPLASVELVAINATTWAMSFLTGEWCGGVGYVMGGSSAAGDGSAVSTIENYDFKAQTSAAISATLSAATLRGNEAGINMESAGYMMGGMNAASSAINVIAKLTFADEVRSNISATLDTSRYHIAGVETRLYGYGMGGDTGSASTAISKLIFSTEAEANLSATLPAARLGGCPCYSPTAGYYLGGFNASAQTAIYKLLFSTEATSTPAATLNTASSYKAAVQSSIAGYGMGGTGTTTAIVKFLYSSEADSVLAATLDNTNGEQTGLHMHYGVALGGRQDADGATMRATIEDFNFGAETSAALAATLDTAKRALGGIQPVGL